ncbi:MAG: hypothetical protein A3K18_22325 [Lentisphaerae bacterium RIFOXYA12_64_32]|nr:MAG: hypothetical protein A3K18_22325 [Lentisphaerae bacterium RIFOXYA12_64_32]
MMLFGFWLILLPLFVLLGLAVMAFWVWMLIDCATREPSAGNDKVVWVAIILVVHVAGALIYFFVRRPQRIRQYGA